MGLNEPWKAVRNRFVESQNVSDSWTVVWRLEAKLTLEPIIWCEG
jgi:hypothetical protein